MNVLMQQGMKNLFLFTRITLIFYFSSSLFIYLFIYIVFNFIFICRSLSFQISSTPSLFVNRSKIAGTVTRYPSRHRTITCRVVRREAWETLGFSDVTRLAGPACPRTRSTLPTSNRKCERGRQHSGEAGFRSCGTSADRHDYLCRGTHAEEQRSTEKSLRQNLSASWQKVRNRNIC